jgi:ABC-type spermidine/putrescine transport system permease subunit I
MARRNDAVAITSCGGRLDSGPASSHLCLAEILGNKGPVARFMRWGRPPQLLFTSFASTLGMTHVLLPYMVLALYGVMRKIDPSYLRAAESLGARPFAAFRLVFLPLSLPGVVNGCVLVFTMCLGFYITPILLGTPKDMMISQLISQQIEDLLAWGFASAIAGCCCCTLVLLGVYNRARSGPAVGMTTMARHVHVLPRSPRSSRAVGDHRADVVLEAIRSISSAGLMDRLLRQYFANRSWLDATANSFIIAFGSTVFTLVAALPAAFGFARYRFRGKGAINLLMMLPIIVPAIVSALGYYSFLGPARLVGTHAGMIIAHSVLSIPVAFQSGGLRLRPQSRARRHERGSRPAAHLLLRDLAGAAARDPDRRPVRLPALLQRGRGGDLHRRSRCLDVAEEDVRIDPPRIRPRHRRGIDAAHRLGADRRADLVLFAPDKGSHET